MFLDLDSEFSISNLYDSHVHWQATGDIALGLNLKGIRSFSEIPGLDYDFKKSNSDWVVGFGWDENLFLNKNEIHRSTLDKLFPDRPVLLSRTDGHASVLNSQALIKLGWINNQGEILKHHRLEFIEIGPDGFVSGVLKEKAHIESLMALPAPGPDQIKKSLLAAQHIFLQKGFTHIRDMTMGLDSWNVAFDMEQNKDLLLKVECFFSVESCADFDQKLQNLILISKESSAQLFPRGIKLFFDGSLGSRTALVKNKKGVVIGHQLWSDEDFKYILTKTWQAGFQVAVHTLGDEAVDRVARMARELSAQGISGVLNLEHVQVLRSETLKILKPLHVKIHMQPCHWHTDKIFLEEQKDFEFKNIFPWSRLANNQIPIFWGSDSPIEPPDFFRNIEAVHHLEKYKIPAIPEPWINHQYPEKNSHYSKSIFKVKQLKELYILDRKII